MKAPLFIRPLTQDEHQALRAGLSSPSLFTQRRCRMLLANADGITATRIAARLGCAQQTVLNALQAFAGEGLDCLIEKSHRPKTPRRVIAAGSAEEIRAIVQRHPREFGKSVHRWTYAAVAEVAYEQGLSERAVSEETIRQVVLRLGLNWKRDARSAAIESRAS